MKPTFRYALYVGQLGTAVSLLEEEHFPPDDDIRKTRENTYEYEDHNIMSAFGRTRKLVSQRTSFNVHVHVDLSKCSLAFWCSISFDSPILESWPG